VSIPPIVHVLSSTAPTNKSGYFGRLVEACLNGITEPDVLFEHYLSPVAQALYWREFHDQSDRARLVQDALVRWIDNKHNGMISRISEGRRKDVVSAIRHVVKNLPGTPVGIRSFWEKVVANDQAFPAQTVSLVDCIDAVVPIPVQVTTQNLKTLPALLKSGRGSSTKGNTYNVSCVTTSLPLSSLPTALEASLRNHLQRLKVRTKRCQDRVVLFAHRLINEIGLEGTRTIDGRRMNHLAGLGHGRKHIKKYKLYLVGAGILKPGWEKTYSKAKKIASRYDLTPWAINELKHTAANPPTRL
jgi:hypothetical protein